MWPINVFSELKCQNYEQGPTKYLASGFLYYFQYKPTQFGPLLGEVKLVSEKLDREKGTYQRQGSE